MSLKYASQRAVHSVIYVLYNNMISILCFFYCQSFTSNIYPEPCLEGEIRLNNFFSLNTPSTIEEFYRDPHQIDTLLIKDELARGKVEMCTNATWGTVCEGTTWNHHAASVACHQLGFSRFGLLHYYDVPSHLFIREIGVCI